MSSAVVVPTFPKWRAPCGYCGAPVGEPCRRPNGDRYIDTRGRDRVHARRRPKARTEAPEVDELGAAARRFARAIARRAAEGDDAALGQLVEVRAAIDEALGDAARAMHGFGYSWTEIGDRLGTTRQNARQRFGTRLGEGVSS